MTPRLDKAIERFKNTAEFEKRNDNLQGYLNFRQLAEWLTDYKRLLEQEPCENAVSREAVIKTINNNTADERDGWLCIDNDLVHEIEKLPSVTPQPCDDAISRDAVEKITWEEPSYTDALNVLAEVRDKVRALPPVTQKCEKCAMNGSGSKYCDNCGQKSGKWIAQDVHNCHTDFRCSECDYIHSFMHLYGEPSADYTYCPNCGCLMVEPQESEE